VLNRNSKGR